MGGQGVITTFKPHSMRLLSAATVSAGLLLLVACTSVSPTRSTSANSPHDSVLHPEDPPSIPDCVELAVSDQHRLDEFSDPVIHYVLRNACPVELGLCTWPAIRCARAALDHHGIPVAAGYPYPELRACLTGHTLLFRPGEILEGDTSLTRDQAGVGLADVRCEFVSWGLSEEPALIIHIGSVRSNWVSIPMSDTPSGDGDESDKPPNNGVQRTGTAPFSMASRSWPPLRGPGR